MRITNLAGNRKPFPIQCPPSIVEVDCVLRVILIFKLVLREYQEADDHYPGTALACLAMHGDRGVGGFYCVVAF
jgi:hypothetical protein